MTFVSTDAAEPVPVGIFGGASGWNRFGVPRIRSRGTNCCRGFALHRNGVLLPPEVSGVGPFDRYLIASNNFSAAVVKMFLSCPSCRAHFHGVATWIHSKKVLNVILVRRLILLSLVNEPRRARHHCEFHILVNHDNFPLRLWERRFTSSQEFTLRDEHLLAATYIRGQGHIPPLSALRVCGVRLAMRRLVDGHIHGCFSTRSNGHRYIFGRYGRHATPFILRPSSSTLDSLRFTTASTSECSGPA